MKKIGVLFLFIFLIGFISAESCSITTSCNPDNTVMKLSSSTNAHGELWNETNYDYYLCCDFARTHTCSGTNKVLGLSSSTNAHAEVPSQNNYATSVCYGNLECTSRENNCNPAEITMSSLSDETNAHIGNADNYDLKICCAGICEEGKIYYRGNCVDKAVLYWADSVGNYITEKDVALGTTQIMLVIENSYLDEGTEVSFEIWEKDLFADDYIRTLSTNVDANKEARTLWKVSQADLDKTPNDYSKFYFKAEDEKSGYLSISVVKQETYCSSIGFCKDYETEVDCEADICSISGKNVENDNGFCGDGFLCECTWDEGVCGPNSIYLGEGECGNGVQETGEQCDDGNLNNNDGCSSTCMYEIINPGTTGCPKGTELCSDGTCSLNCEFTDLGITCNRDAVCDSGEGCSCPDCDNEQDECVIDLFCSLIDTGCCNPISDGICNLYCGNIDPDCSAICGNSKVEFGEQCDDGNLNNNDGCSSDCKLEVISPGSTGCPEGTSLCSDGTCSLNCYFTDRGTTCDYDGNCDSGEGCSCPDCGGEQDRCASGLICSSVDRSCCSSKSDGICNPYCSYIDPDCASADNPSIIGSCLYKENSSDDCEDGFLEYSWLGIYNWDLNNIFDDNPDGDDYFQSEDGKWRYDPFRKSSQCIDGNNIVQCPVATLLKYFNFVNVITAIIIICLVYYFLSKKKPQKKSKKKKSKR